MKRVQVISISIILYISIPHILLAAEPVSKVIDAERQCALENRGCEILESNLGSTYSKESMKEMMTNCPEEKVPLASIKGASNLIIHNYRIEACTINDLNQTQEDPSFKVLDWGISYYNFISTEYQLGKLSKNEFDQLANEFVQTEKVIYQQINTAQAQQQKIQELTDKLEKLQSHDHQLCRMIQLNASMTPGTTPPQCDN